LIFDLLIDLFIYLFIVGWNQQELYDEWMARGSQEHSAWGKWEWPAYSLLVLRHSGIWYLCPSNDDVCQI